MQQAAFDCTSRKKTAITYHCALSQGLYGITILAKSL
jgi:hypothetical protein